MTNEELYGNHFGEVHATAEAAHPELAGSILGGLFLHCYSLVKAQFQLDRSAISVIAVMKEIEAMHEKTSGMVTDSIQLPQHTEPQKIELACKNGCSYCCHIRLTSTPLEVIALAERLRAEGMADRSLALLRRYEYGVKDLTADKRLVALLPCPFLKEDICTIYSMRPSACRTYHSFDVSRCMTDFEKPEAMIGVPQNPVRLDIGSVLYDAVEQACIELEIQHETIEFVTGLRIALEDTSIITKWLNGEDCLKDAVDSELMDRAEESALKMNEQNS